MARDACPHCGAVAIPDVPTHIAFTAECLNARLDEVLAASQPLSEGS